MTGDEARAALSGVRQSIDVDLAVLRQVEQALDWSDPNRPVVGQAVDELDDALEALDWALQRVGGEAAG